MSALLQRLFTWSHRHPFLTVSLAIFLLLCIADHFLWQRQKAIAFRHEEQRRSGEAMLTALTGHARVTNELKALEEALKQIDQNLIVEADLAENLGYFYQVETLSNIRLAQLNQFNSQPSADDNPFRAIPFSVRVTGTYAQIMHFIRELETGPRVLRIRNFDFSRGDLKTGGLSLGLTVEVLGSQ